MHAGRAMLRAAPPPLPANGSIEGARTTGIVVHDGPRADGRKLSSKLCSSPWSRTTKKWCSSREQLRHAAVSAVDSAADIPQRMALTKEDLLGPQLPDALINHFACNYCFVSLWKY